MSLPKRASKPIEMTFTYGARQITFQVVTGDRRTLAISVHPNRRVTVAAPAGLSQEAILAKVRRKGPWIVRQQDAFGEAPAPLPPRQYLSGETWTYLGRQYRLKVVKSRDEKVRLSGQFLWVYVRDLRDKSRKRELLRNWYLAAAHAYLRRRLEVLADQPGEGLPTIPRWRLQPMKTRWGSCSPRGLILINPALIHAPPSCIEYVLVHELCHLVEMNHTPMFYGLLSAALPDWQARKERLELQAQVQF